jgi:hypothetical protein
MNPADVGGYDAPPTLLRTLRTLLPDLLLALAVWVVLAPSLTGSFLNYDDDWLLLNNPWLRAPLGTFLRAAWTDFSEPTRRALGAEYLPVRDTFVWLEAQLVGVRPVPLRLVGAALYALAAVLARRWFRRALGATLAAELAAWLFALHPVHLESAAWLAGQKDLLSLVFTLLAVLAHGDRRRGATWVCVALAVWSKSTAVVLPVLLVLEDLRQARPPDRGTLLGASLLVLLAFGTSSAVGRAVGMVQPPLGGSRWTAALSVAPVFWRYLLCSLAPAGLSVAHRVPVRAALDPVAGMALAGLLALVPGTVLALRRGARGVALLLGLFVVPLLPVSQVLVPLQNVMADRYLCVAVAAPCALLGLLAGALEARRAPWGRLLGAALVLAFGALAAQRAWVFGDSVRLWEDALGSDPGAPLPLLQLGHARRAAGDLRGAETAWTALWRQSEDPSARCNGAGNLSRLLAADGRDLAAIALLREAERACPSDPKVLNNLAELLARRGIEPEARQRFDALVRRFPGYAPGRRNRATHYGP